MAEQAFKPIITVPIIWVIGGPGSGKGTQCEKIAKMYNFHHISVGNLIRNQVKNKSERSKQLKRIMDRGDLIPDDIVLEVVQEEILKNCCSAKGFLLDGFPRDEHQAVLFEQRISPVFYIFYLEMSNEVMMNRLKYRATYSGRSDDKEEVMKNRIAKFNEKNNKILKTYWHKVKKVNGEKSIDAAFREIQNLLEPIIDDFEMRREQA